MKLRRNRKPTGRYPDVVRTACVCCSPYPEPVPDHPCEVSNCPDPAVCVVMFYWRPWPGIGGRKNHYLCNNHRVEFARHIYDGGDKLALFQKETGQ